MNVLVVGNGGREHALAWKLLQSPQVSELFCAPGNGGTATLKGCTNLAIAVSDQTALVAACRDHAVKLVVVGPEVPLAEGLGDCLRAEGIAVFGPNADGARIEASKAWAKDLMAEAGVPTARSGTFTEAAPARAYVEAEGAPIVVKADGLAAGKGVVVAATVEEALEAVEAAFSGAFGSAGQMVVIEECLTGPELSLLTLTDGKTFRPLLPAQDHKRVGEGDTGPNTGGMGVYAPAPLGTPELIAEVERTILAPTVAALQARGIDYRGILYAGLMITPDGPKVIEYNCRFGDPETQAVLPLLESDLAEVLLACAEGRLDSLPPLDWKPAVAACVVAAAGGYPGDYRKGDAIAGLAAAAEAGAEVFHAGTALQDGVVVTSGGRVLNVVALGENFDRAFERSYTALDRIHFDGLYCRRDIGWQVRSR